jgi:hypothetical protein
VSLPATAFREISWREGTDRKLRSSFAAVRVRPALIEWPRGEAEPTRYWMSTLPVDTKLKALIKMAKHRWIIERNYEELKRELGLGHFEGRTWRVASRTLGWRSASDERCAPRNQENNVLLPQSARSAGALRSRLRLSVCLFGTALWFNTVDGRDSRLLYPFFTPAL